MAAELGTAVKTGYRLAKVAKNADGTTQLTFTVGNKTVVVNADHTVLALPFAVLRTLDVSGAGFAQWKLDAINLQGAGRNAKINTQFSNRIWYQSGPWGGPSNGNTYSDTGYQNTWEVSRAQPGTSGILVAYSGGNVSLGLKSTLPWANTSNSVVDGDTKTMLTQLEKVYPGITAQWNGKAAESKPFLDPNLKLAYSYWKVGQYQTIAGNERKAQGNIHFAGEHCSIDFQGYMEGGASEGQRAAQEVLDAINSGMTVAAFAP
jgi:monoamine oxidase